MRVVRCILIKISVVAIMNIVDPVLHELRVYAQHNNTVSGQSRVLDGRVCGIHMKVVDQCKPTQVEVMRTSSRVIVETNEAE